MDLLKTCITNACNLQIPNTPEGIAFYAYELPKEPAGGLQGESPGHPLQAKQVITDLRARDVVQHCTFDGELVWTFGATPSESDELARLGFKRVRDGFIEPHRTARLSIMLSEDPQGGQLFRLLLSSMEGALAKTLGNRATVRPIAPLTWIVSYDDGTDANGESACQSMCVSTRLVPAVTGALTLLPSVTPSKLDSLEALKRETRIVTVPAGLPVLLAPSGHAAVVLDDDSPEVAAKSDDLTAHSSPRKVKAGSARQSLGENWKASVLQGLASAGLHVRTSPDTPSDVRWIRVRLSQSATPSSPELGPKQVCYWPVEFCFATKTDLCASTSVGRALLAAQTYEDSLSFAEQWLLGAEDRLVAEMAAQDAPPEAEAQDETPALQSETGPDFSASPLYLRNQEMAGAAGVYPTPPDGILPAASSDAVNMSSAAAEGPPEGPPEGPDLPTTEAPEEPGSKSPSLGFEVDNFENDNSDLFGEIDEDTFDGPDITDADFNFFDDESRPAFSRTGLNGIVLDDRQQSAEYRNDQIASVDMADPETSQPLGVTGPQAPDQQHEEDNNDSESHPLLNVGESRPMGLLSSAVDDTYTEQRPGQGDVVGTQPTTPPLSPFAVNEHLFPLPIPASTARLLPTSTSQSNGTMHNKAFGTITFNDALSQSRSKYGGLGRYSSAFGDDDKGHAGEVSGRVQSSRSISLPHKERENARSIGARTKSSIGYNGHDRRDRDSSGSSSADEDSSDDGSNMRTKRPDTTMILSVHKRKRDETDDGPDTTIGPTGQLTSDDDEVPRKTSHQSIDTASSEVLLRCLLDGQPQVNLLEPSTKLIPGFGRARMVPPAITHGEAVDIWNNFNLTDQDLVEIAQLFAEQCNFDHNFFNGTKQTDPLLDGYGDEAGSEGEYIASRDASSTLFQSLTAGCEHGLSALSLMSTVTIAKSTEATPTPQPHPIARRSGATPGNIGFNQHLFPIPAPLIRLGRAGTSWDMLSSALNFWDTLGLEPQHGPKKVRACIVTPGNDAFCVRVKSFLDDLGSAYESNKLGEHRAIATKGLDGIVQYSLADQSANEIISEILAQCEELSDVLAAAAKDDHTGVFVVYIMDPVPEYQLGRYICVCLHALQARYVASCLSSDLTMTPPLLLRILPISAVLPDDGLALLDSTWLTALARSVYNQCPSKKENLNEVSKHWRIHSTPCVTLASPLSRKVNLSLSGNPPKNLIQEAQVLHLAYAISSDGGWLTAAWTDYTGAHQHTSSYCLLGDNDEAVLTAVRDVTSSMMSDSTTWRVIVARVGCAKLVERRIWRAMATPTSASTLVEVDVSPSLQVMPPADGQIEPTNLTTPAMPSSGGALTPATTPQASNLTVSPDAQGNTAPGTPVAAENVSDNTAPDPDAHLVDSRDETWALIVPFATTHAADPYAPKLAISRGMLLKRGTATPEAPLPSLGVDMVENTPPRTPTNVTSWMGGRSPEGVLREVLAWYRGLALMAKIRGVKGAEKGNIPWHVATAMNGAEGLVGFLE